MKLRRLLILCAGIIVDVFDEHSRVLPLLTRVETWRDIASALAPGGGDAYAYTHPDWFIGPFYRSIDRSIGPIHSSTLTPQVQPPCLV